MIRELNPGDVLFLLKALQWTILLSIVAFAGGAVCGAIIALARVSKITVIRLLAAGYVRFFQGTPLLIQLFLFYFMPAIFGIQVVPLIAAACALSLHAGAYLGEIWRGAIEAIPAGQHDAAAALGLRKLQRMRLIVFPQAFKLAIPPTVGFLVQLVKETSLTSTIGFLELSFAGHLLVSSTHRPFTIYLMVAAGYFLICYPLARAARTLETRMSAPQNA